MRSKYGQVFFICLAVRLASVPLVVTWFVPDEYWQSLEVAHHRVFGFGLMTWEWDLRIRSSIYPTIFATLYQLLRCTGLDSAAAIIITPRVLQGLPAERLN